jgi:hypothetical protein
LGFLVWKYVNHLATLCLTFKVWNKLNEALHTTWIAKRYYKFIKPISRLHIGSKMRHFCCKKSYFQSTSANYSLSSNLLNSSSKCQFVFQGCLKVHVWEWTSRSDERIHMYIHSFPSKRCRCQYGMVATCFKVYILIGFCIWSILLTELY